MEKLSFRVSLRALDLDKARLTDPLMILLSSNCKQYTLSVCPSKNVPLAFPSFHRFSNSHRSLYSLGQSRKSGAEGVVAKLGLGTGPSGGRVAEEARREGVRDGGRAEREEAREDRAAEEEAREEVREREMPSV